MLEASSSEMITVALRRVDFASKTENILDYIPKTVRLLPNTPGEKRNRGGPVARDRPGSGVRNLIKIE